MNNKLNTAYHIVSLIGLIVAFIAALYLPLDILFNVEVGEDILNWVKLAISVLLLASLIISVFTTKKTVHKIAQIFISVGILANLAGILLYQTFSLVGNDIYTIITYVNGGATGIGCLIWLVTLPFKSLRATEKAPYFFAVTFFIYAASIILPMFNILEGLELSLMATMSMKMLIGLATNFYYALELKHPESNKPMFWFLIVVFIAVTFPAAIVYIY